MSLFVCDKLPISAFWKSWKVPSSDGIERFVFKLDTLRHSSGLNILFCQLILCASCNQREVGCLFFFFTFASLSIFLLLFSQIYKSTVDTQKSDTPSRVNLCVCRIGDWQMTSEKNQVLFRRRFLRMILVFKVWSRVSRQAGNDKKDFLCTPNSHRCNLLKTIETDPHASCCAVDVNNLFRKHKFVYELHHERIEDWQQCGTDLLHPPRLNTALMREVLKLFHWQQNTCTRETQRPGTVWLHPARWSCHHTRVRVSELDDSNNEIRCGEGWGDAGSGAE